MSGKYVVIDDEGCLPIPEFPGEDQEKEDPGESER